MEHLTNHTALFKFNNNPLTNKVLSYIDTECTHTEYSAITEELNKAFLALGKLHLTSELSSVAHLVAKAICSGLATDMTRTKQPISDALIDDLYIHLDDAINLVW